MTRSEQRRELVAAFRRVYWFFRGDIERAEELDGYPSVPGVPWLEGAGNDDEKVAEYALDAARRSAEHAESGVRGIQDKASAFLTLVTGLVPLSIAAVAISASGAGTNPGRLLAAVLFLAGALLLVASAVMAAMSAGLYKGGGLHIGRLKSEAGSSLAALKASEADAWHFTAQTAMESGMRKARDLFTARRLALIALTLSLAAAAVLLLSIGGDVLQLGPHSPTPSPVAAIGLH